MQNMKRISHLVLVITILLGSFSNTTAQDEGMTYGVFIAINDYSEGIWKSLDTPVNDAEAIISVLNEKYVFDQIMTIYNEAANRKAIIANLNLVAKQLKAEDRLLIFYSGHGIEVGTEGYWIPSDAKSEDLTEMISNTEIRDILGKMKSQHILLMVDACFSGGVFKSAEGYIRNEGSVDYYDLVDRLISREALVSGALEPLNDEKYSRSIFVKYIVKYLNRNKSQYFSTSELFELIKYPVAANSPTIPLFGHIQNTGHEGGQFVFELTGFEVEAVVVEEEVPIIDCSQLTVEIEEGKKVIFESEDKRLHALSSNPEVDYQWFEGVAPLMINSPILEVMKSGEYTIVITDKYKCSKAATIDVTVIYKDIYVNILEGSKVEFVQQGTLTAKTNIPSAVIEWRYNNFIVGKGLTLNVKEEGIYTINLKSSDGRTIASVSSRVTIKDRVYTVQVGDNIERLARKFYKNESKKTLIINANPSIVENNGGLKVGELIVIPKGNESKEITIIKIGGVKDLVPLSAPGIYKNGIVTDISVQVFKSMNMETSIEFMPLNKVKAGVYNGLFTVAQPLAKTPMEALSFRFSEPLYKIVNVFFVKSDSDIEYTKSKDIKGNRVAVTKGISIKELDALAAKRTVKLVPVVTLEMAFQMLEKGEVDMVAAPQLVGLLTLKNMTTFGVNSFKILEKEIGTEALYLVISKNHPSAEEIIADFNKVFLRLKEEGKIDELINKHLDQYQKP